MIKKNVFITNHTTKHWQVGTKLTFDGKWPSVERGRNDEKETKSKSSTAMLMK